MDQGFIDIITKMANERGAAILVDGSWKKWLADYAGSQYPKETDLLKRILNANCAEYINDAQDVPERKQALLKRLEDDEGLSPKSSAEYLDLLGLLLKGDTSKCGAVVQVAVIPQKTVPASKPQCPSCGKEIEGAWKACPYCGAALGKKVCLKCGKEMESGWKACPHCGAGEQAGPALSVPDGMVRIPGGTFMMGSPASDPERKDNETQHEVRVSGFYMGKYPVTVADFRRFTDTSGYKTEAETGGGGYIWTDSGWEIKEDANWKNPYMSQGEDHPVVLISWNDAVQYCNWQSREQGLVPAYSISGDKVNRNRNANGCRLPTEAEWEYVCRAGTSGPFNTGKNITTDQANYDGNYPYEKNAKGIYRKETTPVGSFAPNAWGLYNMHGNVWEWCWDRYGSYSSGAQTDPLGASSGSYRVFRGGSWNGNGQYLRSAYRSSFTPSNRYNILGFRLARP